MYNFNNQHLLKLNLLSSMFHVKQIIKFYFKNVSRETMVAAVVIYIESVSRETITFIVGFDR